MDARAREWFVSLLQEDVGREDLLAWGEWLEADESHRAAYERVEAAWALMQSAEVEAPTAEELALDRYSVSLSVGRWRKAQRGALRLISPVAAALGAVLLLAVAGGLWSDARIHPSQQFKTQRAEHMEAQLADGSHVRLGAMTTLKVAFEGHRRTVGLNAGEALFQVAHDRQRPFVVHTPLGEFTAVGTAFDVNIESRAVTLTVTEGIVSVAPDPNLDAVREDPAARSAIQIHAGQRLRMERDGARLILAMSDDPGGAAWTSGRLEYRNASLRSVIDDVNRYATTPIVMADADLANLQYTGTVQLQAADTWVLGLPVAFPLTVELSNDGQFVLRRKTPASVPIMRSSWSATPGPQAPGPQAWLPAIQGRGRSSRG
ncbi:FecR family protein [Phenylobacterium hankyongense]|uniref:FecR family protein n=1 Tax=Phenylobacterium hankyongense TaxID=1813876 RepID=UPI001403F8AD|nr:FecR domain-containing protein [Phenylobacterium hankyongense]